MPVETDNIKSLKARVSDDPFAVELIDAYLKETPSHKAVDVLLTELIEKRRKELVDALSKSH